MYTEWRIYIVLKKLEKTLDISVFYGAPGGIRTPDLPVRSRTLYPTKLLVHTQYYNCFWNNFQDVFEDFAKKFINGKIKLPFLEKKTHN